VRDLLILVVVGILLAGLSACGGSSPTSDRPVAQVIGVGAISSATLAHWMPVEARIIYSERPTGPPPAGVVPDPPGFSRCISFLRTYLQGKITVPAPNKSSSGSTGELKRLCQHYYGELKAITLNTLIGWYWIIGQGKELGLTANDHEVKERLQTVNKTLFPTSEDFANYLRWTDESLADMLFRSRVQLFEAKIREKAVAAAKRLSAIANVKRRQQALSRLSAELSPAGRWLGRTTCQPEFVVSSCKEYKGPLAPGFPD
jgi:hypothetical protein